MCPQSRRSAKRVHSRPRGAHGPGAPVRRALPACGEYRRPRGPLALVRDTWRHAGRSEESCLVVGVRGKVGRVPVRVGVWEGLGANPKRRWLSGRALLAGDSGLLEVLTSGFVSRAPSRAVQLSGGLGVGRVTRAGERSPGRPPPFSPAAPSRGTTCGCHSQLFLSSGARPQGRGGGAGAGWAVPRGNRPARERVQAQLALLRVPSGSWEAAGIAEGRRRALPGGARGRPGGPGRWE